MLSEKKNPLRLPMIPYEVIPESGSNFLGVQLDAYLYNKLNV